MDDEKTSTAFSTGYDEETASPSYPPPPQVPQMYPKTASNLPYPPYGDIGMTNMTCPIGLIEPPPSYPPQWSTGLFDCFDDIPFCCLTTWCPCITFGRTAEIIDRGASSCGMTGGLYTLILVFTGLQSIYACMYRAKFKQQTGMPQDTFEDCCTHFWCHGCALCQEYRELQRQGLQPSIGWYGNLEAMRMRTGLTNPPIVPGGMTR